MAFVPADGERQLSLVASFSTVEVLAYYSPEFKENKTLRISRWDLADFMETLVSVWLRDLAYQWKPGEPPKKKELAEVDILSRFEGGARIERELMRGDSVR